jgi:hypothetical protein
LLLLRNGGGMCGCPFSLIIIIIINFFIRIYFLSDWNFFFLWNYNVFVVEILCLYNISELDIS